MEPLLDYNGAFARSLLGAAAVASNSTIDSSYLGSYHDMRAAMGINWFAFSVCVVSLLYYAFHYSKSMTGWEEVYVCVIELAKVILELFWEPYAPATITTTNGKHVPWLRYAEWLLTCPVILIHMSNITGLNSEYNKRTMALLVSDIGTIVMGVAAAFGTGYVKVVFYLIGCVYAANQFINSYKVYTEAHKEVPDGRCKSMVKTLGYLYFSSWMAFPLLFLLGPEGFKAIDQWSSVIGHTVADLAAKNLWGLLAHHLRIMIAEEIVAGWDPEEHKVKHGVPIEEHAHGGESGVVAVVRTLNSMNSGKSGSKLSQEKRSSSDRSVAASAAGPVRVILGVMSADMVEYFQSLVASVTVPLEVTSAMGESPLLLLAAEAAAAPAGTDVVLVPAEYCSDRSNGGLVARLKALGHRLVVYGWTPGLADMIEACDIDAFLEGPSWGKGINPQVFTTTLVQMQEARLKAIQSTTTQGGMVRSFSNMNLNAASNPLYSNSGSTAAAATAAAPAPAAVPRSPLGRHSPVHAIARQMSKGKDNNGRQSPIGASGVTMDFSASRGNSNGGGATNMISNYTPNESAGLGRVSGGPSFGGHGNLQNLAGSNAMSFGNVPGSQSGGQKSLRTSGTDAAALAAAAAAAGVRASPALSEYDLLQQLMGEISRLKKELNE